MAFIENLQHKIAVDRLTHRVIESLAPLESGRRPDFDAMRRLLALAGYQLRPLRDLELYCPDFSLQPNRILVLDRELPLYYTTIADVLIRKSPTIKEMVSIRNAIKILNDKDVIQAKGAAAVHLIRQESLAGLVWTYSREDIEAICEIGRVGLTQADAEAVVRSLEMLAELLDLHPPPVVMAPPELFVLRQSPPERPGGALPETIIYSRSENRLLLFAGEQNQTAPVVSYQEMVEKLDDAALQEKAVLDVLGERILQTRPEVRWEPDFSVA